MSAQIKLEKDAKPVVNHQRRLKPKMKEVVRNEILKLLEAGIIYHVADSQWVSPVIVSLRRELLLLFLMINTN